MEWCVESMENVRKRYTDLEIWAGINSKSLASFVRSILCPFQRVPAMDIQGGKTKEDIDELKEKNRLYAVSKAQKQENANLRAGPTTQAKKRSKPRLNESMPVNVDSENFSMMNHDCAYNKCDKDCGLNKLKRILKYVSNAEIGVGEKCTMKVKLYDYFTKGTMKVLEPRGVYLTVEDFIIHFQLIWSRFSPHEYARRWFGQVLKKLSYEIKPHQMIVCLDWAAQVIFDVKNLFHRLILFLILLNYFKYKLVCVLIQYL